VWKALSDPNRRKILDLLREGPRITNDLCNAFEFSRFAVMKHLNVLEEAGLVVVQRKGRQRWNYLNAVPIRRIYERWVSEYEAHWATSLLQLQEFVERKGGRAPMAEGTITAPALKEIHIEQAIVIKARPALVFAALTNEISTWWRAPYFHRQDAQGIVLEPHLGGRLYEEWGDGEGLLLAIVSTIKRPYELRLSGSMGMPGPVSGVIAFQLEEKAEGTLLKLSHHAFGEIDEQAQANYSAGWSELLGMHLRQFVEQ
jgi:DNA-binding transcriptional ArsR family regulator/uncharacterized protein YndB with AHSA1/START domain